ncbi:VOC family protein [Aquisediminimonas profunda]|uniref:VOC family protein n=1 Tax=Aquisediminimonas profunda TaxID=1550733 RepID=UPI001C62B05B|nr:VOC family protein [Aquisediminimonas profunda]
MRIKRFHHVSFDVTDLDATARFASDFGLIEAVRSDSQLFMRTSGGDAFAYVAHKAEHAAFNGFAFEVESESDLAEAVACHGASPIRDLGSPGRGKAVTLTDPNGFAVDLVYGVARRKADEFPAPLVQNSCVRYQRLGRFEPKRKLGPAQLARLGHIGIFVPSFAQSFPWYKGVLGLIPSEIYHVPGKPEAQIISFMRLDRGEERVDHHTIALMQSQSGETACHHISFEVQDFEAQFVAHRYLEDKGYELVWGVGRHPHGSHVFDVWRDPDGNRFETFSDTDLLVASDGTRIWDLHDVEMDIWSSDPPDRYFA